MAEDQVLVVLDAALAVEVDVEQLALPERLGDAVGEVEPGHLLVADLGVEADHLGAVQRGDEGERVPDGGQQDVAAGLVRLGLERETQVVAAVDDVLGRAGRPPRGSGPARPGCPWPTSYSAPSRPPHMTNVCAPSSAARSTLRSTLRSAYRRTSRSLLVKPPSLNTGWVNRLVVTIGTTRPVSSRALRNRVDVRRAGSASSAPNGIRSSSWKVTPYAPSSASRCTASTGVELGAGGVAERVAGRPAHGPEPEGEACLVGRGGTVPIPPTVHRHKVLIFGAEAEVPDFRSPTPGDFRELGAKPPRFVQRLNLLARMWHCQGWR